MIGLGDLGVDVRRSVFSASIIMLAILGLCLLSNFINWFLLIVFLALALFMGFKLFLSKKGA
jgi:uncharacterized membrane protein YdbT with pleckstrin-like domain